MPAAEGSRDVLRRAVRGFLHWCPACEEMHLVPPGWHFNGDMARPTFRPALQHTFGAPNGRRPRMASCQYIITDGRIQYCVGSWHGRADTVRMRPVSEISHQHRDEDQMKPLVIMVGADKGGVGKTTISRALDEYLRQRQVGCKVFDGEWPAGDLRQFAAASEVVDMQSLDHQMRVFDRLTGVTLIDIKAGLFTTVLESLARTGLLDDVREGRFNLALLHVLGPSAASLAEMAAISEKLGAGAHHILVKNYVNESGFKEWDSDPRFAEFLSRARVMSIPHLEARACTEVQRRGVAFGAFIERPESRVLSGYVRAWLRDTFAALDGAGLGELIDQAKAA